MAMTRQQQHHLEAEIEAARALHQAALENLSQLIEAHTDALLRHGLNSTQVEEMSRLVKQAAQEEEAARAALSGLVPEEGPDAEGGEGGPMLTPDLRAQVDAQLTDAERKMRQVTLIVAAQAQAEEARQRLRREEDQIGRAHV